MLKNIKSLFILKKIFSLLGDYTLLKSIKYNNSLKSKLNINLYYYKIFKGNYIVYDSNGKGKEYNFNGKLLFEGEYLNGKNGIRKWMNLI